MCANADRFVVMNFHGWLVFFTYRFEKCVCPLNNGPIIASMYFLQLVWNVNYFFLYILRISLIHNAIKYFTCVCPRNMCQSLLYSKWPSNFFVANMEVYNYTFRLTLISNHTPFIFRSWLKGIVKSTCVLTIRWHSWTQKHIMIQTTEKHE